MYIYIYISFVPVSQEYFAQLYDIKYSYQTQIVSTQLYAFMYSYLILIIIWFQVIISVLIIVQDYYY